MNVKRVLAAMQEIEENRNISQEIIMEALQDSLIKAFRREIGVPDALVEVTIDENTEDMHLYQKFLVVDEVTDDALEVGVDEIDEDLEIGEYYLVEQSIDELGRAAATLAKNVIKQKIREAEKQAVYDEYIDQLHEMILAMIESVEEKFVVVNLGRSLAIMPRSAQMEGEVYREGETLKVVITDVNKDTKGAQILVSRADQMLVRRLFENEVPEIFDGLVEIKAIAREAGDRTKMAVYSHDPSIDAIGACIGPKGSRVQAVIDELKGEKIDIFEWSENMVELVKNALAPAEVIAVFPNEENKGLIVVVEDNQLSLAIGKRGKNARLAVRLTRERIDIKSKTEMEELGIDYMAKMEHYLVDLGFSDSDSDFEILEIEDSSVETQDLTLVEEFEENISSERTEENKLAKSVFGDSSEDNEEESDFAPAVELEDEGIIIHREDVFRPRTEYVSKFEKLADASKQEEERSYRRRKRKKPQEPEVNTAELLKEKEYEIKPEYTEEELEEIRRMEAENSEWYEEEIDFELFDQFYEED